MLASNASYAYAKIPASHSQSPLKLVEDAAEYSRKILIAMLAGCVCSWLTIATTTDARLLVNTASSPLPLVGATVPIAGFYIAAPMILLAVYVYFNLNMQRLWEQLADSPAILPGGRSLDGQEAR